jgi:hypothetical protein
MCDTTGALLSEAVKMHTSQLHPWSPATFLIGLAVILDGVNWKASICKAAVSPANLYWLGGGSIRRAPLDLSSIATVVPHPIGDATDFVIDGRSEALYWKGRQGIYRSKIDGSDIVEIHHFPQYDYGGNLAIDPLRKHLYFSGNDRIQRVDLDGGNLITVIPMRPPRALLPSIDELIVDAIGAKLYWSFENALWRSNLDGSAEEILFETGFYTNDLDIDLSGRKAYWTIYTGYRGQGLVRRANLDGTQKEDLAANLWDPLGVAVDATAGKLYFSDTSGANLPLYDTTIRIANLDGSNQRILKNFGPNALDYGYELALDVLLVPEPTGRVLLLSAMVIAVSRRMTNPEQVDPPKRSIRVSATADRSVGAC